MSSKISAIYQGGIACAVEIFTFLRGYASAGHHVTSSITSSTASPETFMSVIRAQSESSVKSTWHQWWTCQFGILWRMRHKAVSTGPTRGHYALMKSVSDFFGLRYSHQWPAGGNFVALKVLILFLFAQKSRYQ